MYKAMVTSNLILDLYKKYTGRNLPDNGLISVNDFSSINFDRFITDLIDLGINWDGSTIDISELINGSLKINLSDLDLLEINSSTKNIDIQESNISLGIDIQFLSDFPDCIDFWESTFYTSKFTTNEICYCLKKKNPIETFCGLYSCKESIIKVNNNLQWKDIEIKYNDYGKPYFENYSISISHSNKYCISIALFQNSITVNKIISNESVNKNLINEPRIFENNKLIIFFLLIINISIIFFNIYIFIKNN